MVWEGKGIKGWGWDGEREREFMCGDWRGQKHFPKPKSRNNILLSLEILTTYKYRYHLLFIQTFR
jgi:hypothetical protein